MIRNRIDKILQDTEGRTVINIGCCDAPLTAKKLANGGLLHAILSSNRDTFGVDISVESLELMRGAGFQNVGGYDDALEFINSQEISSPITVVVGETIEHIPDLQSFLDGLKMLVKNQSADFIFTTPNILSLQIIVRWLFGKFEAHPDHLVGFNGFLLTQLLASNGFINIEVDWTELERETLTMRDHLYRFIGFLAPHLRGTLYVRCDNYSQD